MAYPRPNIVSHYQVTGKAHDRHGKIIESKQPVFTVANRSFADYLQAPQEKKRKKGSAKDHHIRMKFPRGTFLKIIAEHCRPTEGSVIFGCFAYLIVILF